MTLANSALRALARHGAAFEPVHDTQRTFRVLLEAMARPGTVMQLPVAADGAPVSPWLAAVLVTLVDQDVSLAVTAFDGSDALERFVRQRTAVGSAALDRAEFVVATATDLDPQLPWQLCHGTLEYPNDGATLLLLTSSLAQTSAGGGEVSELSLSGPGVPPGHRLCLAGLPAALFAARTEAAEYPCGIDLILVDPTGRVAALPRSTVIHVQTVAASAPESVGRG